MTPGVFFLYPRRHNLELEREKTRTVDVDLALGGPGKHSWSVQTWRWLTDAGFAAELVARAPPRGIVVAHREALPDWIVPGPEQFLVCVTVDKVVHPWAQLQVVQNERDPMTTWGPLWPTHFVPFWPQPGLLPRDAARGERFETVSYFGVDKWCAPELRAPSFAAALAAEGIRFRPAPRDAFHDYRDVDAVIAVRSFDEQRHDTKPANKLVNAWLAGVPAVLGAESAYRALRRSELDYIEVTSVAETLAAVRRLRQDPGLVRAMVANGLRRAKEVDTAAVVARWRELLGGRAVDLWRSWQGQSPTQRRAFLLRRGLALRHRFRARLSVPAS